MRNILLEDLQGLTSDYDSFLTKEGAMLISVIIPCYNGSMDLPEAIARLRQQNMEIEVIVIDHGSTHHTAKITKSFDYIVHTIPNSRAATARNTGLKLATGDFILFQDHDDLMKKDALANLLSPFQQDASLSAVMGQAIDFISPDIPPEEMKILAPRPQPYYGFLSGAVLFRRNIFDLVGSFTENLATGETVDFLMRFKESGLPTVKIDTITVERRLHSNNTGRTMKKQEHKDYASLLRRKLAARRS